MMNESSIIVLKNYDAACQALAAANSFDEVKEIRDKAEALRAYAKQANNKQAEMDAAGIRMRAERRLGEMLEKTEKAKPGPYSKPGGRSDKTHDRSAPTLKEIGVSKALSSRSRKLAAVPEAVFEEKLAELGRKVREEGERVTVDLLKIGSDKQKRDTLSGTRIELEIPADMHARWVEQAKKARQPLVEWIIAQVNWGIPTAPVIEVKPTPKPLAHSGIQESPVDLKAWPWMAQDSETRRHLRQFVSARGSEPNSIPAWNYFLKNG